MKKNFFITLSLILFYVLNSTAAEEDVIKVTGSACEIFNSSQSKSSVRVRVTDKASYNAVSQIPLLMELRSQILEHDYNVIVYNLVDNYVQNMAVKTTSQDANELCVEVTGAVPAGDIVTVIANYSPTNPAPEYDFKKANGIIEEKNEPLKENKPSEAEVMYNGPEDFDKIPEPSRAEIAYKPEEDTVNPVPRPQIPTEESYVSENSESYLAKENNKTEPEPVLAAASVFGDEQTKALVYITPVAFSNNTHTSKPLGVLKEFFVNEDLYTLLDNPDGADYIISSKVLKAKIDPVNQNMRRLQMVVSVDLKIKGADGFISDHQNRFVLFEKGQNEQEVAMNLLKKLLQKSGEKLIIRIEQNEIKRGDRPFLTPTK